MPAGIHRGAVGNEAPHRRTLRLSWVQDRYPVRCPRWPGIPSRRLFPRQRHRRLFPWLGTGRPRTRRQRLFRARRWLVQRRVQHRGAGTDRRLSDGGARRTLGDRRSQPLVGLDRAQDGGLHLAHRHLVRLPIRLSAQRPTADCLARRHARGPSPGRRFQDAGQIGHGDEVRRAERRSLLHRSWIRRQRPIHLQLAVRVGVGVGGGAAQRRLAQRRRD